MTRPFRYLLFAAVMLSAFSLLASVWLWDQLRDEGVQRRDQSCLIQEAKQRSDVAALKRTYDYLSGRTSYPQTQELRRIALAGLPRAFHEAELDDAPPFCDELGVGEPEPDPPLPERPAGLPGG